MSQPADSGDCLLERARYQGLMPEPFDPETLAFYAREAVGYAARRPLAGEHQLQPFLARLQAGARILELGAGAGRDAEIMIAQGFDLDPTDGVAELAAEGEARIGRPIRIMRFHELDAEATYDGVWANASLLHAPLPELPGILARVYHALKPGGWHSASYKAGTGGARDFLGRYYNYPSETQLAAAYAAAGPWAETIIESYEDGTYGGGLIPWLAVTARKSG
jgi:SAM-dependent methyltransferase